MSKSAIQILRPYAGDEPETAIVDGQKYYACPANYVQSARDPYCAGCSAYGDDYCRRLPSCGGQSFPAWEGGAVWVRATVEDAENYVAAAVTARLER